MERDREEEIKDERWKGLGLLSTLDRRKEEEEEGFSPAVKSLTRDEEGMREDRRRKKERLNGDLGITPNTKNIGHVEKKTHMFNSTPLHLQTTSFIRSVRLRYAEEKKQ